jgi:hypothetical protein
MLFTMTAQNGTIDFAKNSAADEVHIVKLVNQGNIRL